ncbi:MAG: hypothetical protein ACW990_04370 [Promethearchaeota archaeon]|jgi:hypothetical protein
MKNKYRILSVIALYAIFGSFYLVFFLYNINNTPLFLVLSIGSVAVLSTSTAYTVVQSRRSQERVIKEKKYPVIKKSINGEEIEIIEDYVEAIPLIKNYIESEDSYKDIPILDNYIFTSFSKEEFKKINLLKLPKMDKILFIREMLYFDPIERRELIDNMLNNRESPEGDITYVPPNNIIGLEDKIRVYVRSLVEPGEKTKLMIIDTLELVSIIKGKVAVLFDYDLDDFLLSSGGILLDENSLIKENNIDDDDEIALIPSRKKGN